MKHIIFISICLLIFSCKNKKPEEQLASNEYYTCSMDPQVMEKHPGPCPICHMEMTKVTFNEGDMSKLRFNKAQMKLANIKVDTARLTQISEEMNVAANVTLDESQTSIISSKVEGRVEKLHIRNTGELIHEGDLLYEIYSQDLIVAERDYLIAMTQMKSLSKGEFNYTQIADAAKNKLLLWGMSEKQITDLLSKNTASEVIPVFSKQAGVVTDVSIKEGDYVSQGQSIYKLNRMSSVWIEAQLYSDEGRYVKEGETVKIKIYDYPDKNFTGKVSFISPELQTNSKISPIRIELPNPDFSFKPGMAAMVLIQSKTKSAIALPLDAVLQDSKGASIWVQNDKGSFENRMVRTGLRNSDQIEILQGLSEGEKVVISGAYLIQSEYQFKKGSDPMAGMKM
jgi:Cu(I)/Ag(I) efflux system membrane fusion protein